MVARNELPEGPSSSGSKLSKLSSIQPSIGREQTLRRSRDFELHVEATFFSSIPSDRRQPGESFDKHLTVTIITEN